MTLFPFFILTIGSTVAIAIVTFIQDWKFSCILLSSAGLLVWVWPSFWKGSAWGQRTLLYGEPDFWPLPGPGEWVLTALFKHTGLCIIRKHALCGAAHLCPQMKVTSITESQCTPRKRALCAQDTSISRLASRIMVRLRCHSHFPCFFSALKNHTWGRMGETGLYIQCWEAEAGGSQAGRPCFKEQTKQLHTCEELVGLYFFLCKHSFQPLHNRWHTGGAYFIKLIPYYWR